MPLPPYIKRADRAADRERYQTVFAQRRGSIAAPTAGLHFSGALLSALRERGVEIAEITLHVGYGTFQPVRVEHVEDHRLEPERYEISEAAAAAINRALDDGRRVIAVGTTTTRTLESVGRANAGRVVAGTRHDRSLHLSGLRVPGRQRTADEFPSAAVVAADAGVGVRRARARAGRISRGGRSRYRFYSYGDAMLIL